MKLSKECLEQAAKDCVKEIMILEAMTQDQLDWQANELHDGNMNWREEAIDGWKRQIYVWTRMIVEMEIEEGSQSIENQQVVIE